MKKALIVASVGAFFAFEKNDIKILKELGYEIHCASNFKVSQLAIQDPEIILHQIDFERIPWSYSNLNACKQMKLLFRNNYFDLVHCHTPAAGVITRMEAKNIRKNGTKVLYTAHGFHFFKGAPFKNWLLFYSIERYFSRYTDVLITINKEDYSRALRKFKAKRILYIPGVGIDLEQFKFSSEVRNEKRKELNIPDNTIVLLSVGELSFRKNQDVIIKAIHKLKNDDVSCDILYFICGQGSRQEEYNDLIQHLGLQKNVKILGFRTDIKEICSASDIFVFPSLQEGLPVALMEAMACGLLPVASNIRGNMDLIDDGENGFLVKDFDVNSYADLINKFIENRELIKKMSDKSRKSMENFAIDKVENEMRKIYLSITDN